MMDDTTLKAIEIAVADYWGRDCEGCYDCGHDAKLNATVAALVAEVKRLRAALARVDLFDGNQLP